MILSIKLNIINPYKPLYYYIIIIGCYFYFICKSVVLQLLYIILSVLLYSIGVAYRHNKIIL